MKRITYFLIAGMGLIILTFTSCKKDDPFKDEFEPNNGKNSAVTIGLGVAMEAGIGKDDRDWYKFTVDNNDIIDITEIALSDVSADLDVACTLYDENGNAFYSVNAEAGMEFAVNLASRGGSYFMEIYSYSGSRTGYYTLKVTDTDSNDEYEPDESFGDARLVNTFPSGELTGNIIFEASADQPNGDWEFFKVTIAAGKKVSFQVAPDETDMVLQYEIFGSDQLSTGAATVGNAGQALSGEFINSGGTETHFFIKLGGQPSNRLNGDYTISFTEADVAG